MAMNMTY